MTWTPRTLGERLAEEQTFARSRLICYAVTVRTPEGRLMVWERYAPNSWDLIVGVVKAGNQEFGVCSPWSIADWKEVTPHAARSD